MHIISLTPSQGDLYRSAHRRRVGSLARSLGVLGIMRATALVVALGICSALPTPTPPRRAGTVPDLARTAPVRSAVVCSPHLIPSQHQHRTLSQAEVSQGLLSRVGRCGRAAGSGERVKV